MTNSLTKHNLFPPQRPNARSKAQKTDHTARGIAMAENDRREAKTLRLRQARLEMEAQNPEPAPTTIRGKKPPKQPA